MKIRHSKRGPYTEKEMKKFNKAEESIIPIVRCNGFQGCSMNADRKYGVLLAFKDKRRCACGNYSEEWPQ